MKDKKLVAGMFSSVSDAELMMQMMMSQNQPDEAAPPAQDPNSTDIYARQEDLFDASQTPDPEDE